MKRNIAALLGTITGLVLTIAYQNSTQQKNLLEETAPQSTAAPTATSRTSDTTANQADDQTTNSETDTPVDTSSRRPSRRRESSPADPTDEVPPPRTTRPRTAAAPKTYTGQVVMNRFGPVQVQITVAAGKITKADAIQAPDGPSQGYTDRSVPTLNQQTLTAQSAKLDGVSGATFTSDSYRQSLQSALDQANL